jgi:hypothetical protein
MTPISADAATKFCEVCNWAYESWVTHKLLFDENDLPESNIGKVPYFTHRLATITQEYCLQQIAKLHDPAVQSNLLNLTIDYMVRYGDWGERKEEVERLQATLLDLWNRLKPARNKILAHNDLMTLMSDTALGEFPKGLDDEYFVTLQAFVNEVYDKWVGGPWPFNDLAKADVREFLALLDRA